ncbi:cyclic AMP-responsive element-binding protein 3 isoform X2 [Aethina tumida]|uniref:cyclic AMP-responsive element-binding protein 3 isoform X2 n=1 Tax=Aethina tumida TaxID=116153 RepID=UPI00214788B9|nr:cyclic AMP-responsive element-binding protein 3 isoform X2 [Aethina tumida]
MSSDLGLGLNMNINDILNSSGDEANVGMENMDVLSNDNPELLTSEFFDSVFSMENIDSGLFPNFDDDVNLSSDSSSHIDEVLSPQSFYSESEKSSISTDAIDDAGSMINSIDSLDDPILMSFLEPTQNVQVETPVVVKPPVKPTKILIQNPNNKRVIAKPITQPTQIKKNPKVGKPQILKVHSVSNNGRPVLLPLSVKSIKILNANADVTSITNSFKRRKIEPHHTIQTVEDDDTNVVSSTNNQYPALSLTNEEKRLLAKEGIQLPTHHPLTKNEERELKRIRRKIRNKISAQDSRKRKKEYVDGLEERVKRGSEENKNLLQRVKELQRQNRNLIAHVSKLQALICKSTSTKATPSTCLMVVLLSALLVSLPNMRLFEKQQLSTEQEQVAIRRSLLSSQNAEDEGLNMDEFLVFKEDDAEFEGKFGEDALDIENATEKDLSKILEEVGKKYDGLTEKNSSEKMSMFNSVIETVKNFLDKDKPELFGKVDYGGFHNKQGFIEPDIDDFDGDPPAKRMKYTMDEIQFKDPVPGLQDVNIIRNEKIVTVNPNTFTIVNSKDK